MTDASDLDSIDNVAPIYGALVNSLRGFTKTGETTSAFAEYMKMVNVLIKGK